MKAYLLLVLTALSVTGCASTFAGEDAHIYPGLYGQRVVGNESYVTVSNVWNDMDALPLAEAHCEKYSKVAQFEHMEYLLAVYHCVPRNG
jgi:hypothetical protein